MKLSTSPLDEPVITVTGDKGRTKEATWTVATGPSTDRYSDATSMDTVVELTLYHYGKSSYGTSKAFVASLRVSTVYNHLRTDGTTYAIQSTSFGLGRRDSSLTILRKPVERYSDKARDAAFNEALAIVRSMADDARVQHIFTGATVAIDA